MEKKVSKAEPIIFEGQVFYDIRFDFPSIAMRSYKDMSKGKSINWFTSLPISPLDYRKKEWGIQMQGGYRRAEEKRNISPIRRLGNMSPSHTTRFLVRQNRVDKGNA